MPVILLNTTPYDDNILKRILRFAEKTLGLTGTTLVKITCNTSSRRVCGFFVSGMPDLSILRQKGLSSVTKRSMLNRMDSGWVKLSLPSPSLCQVFRPYPGSECVIPWIVSEFLRVTLHEFAHALDYRSDPEAFTSRHFQGYTCSWSFRRTSWIHRPCEISAITQTNAAWKRVRYSATKRKLLHSLEEDIRRKTEA
jgi:hypothetical protein